MLHPLFVWAICTVHPVCSLLLHLFHTSQTAVASIPRHSLSGIREMRYCSRLSVFALACPPTCLTTCPFRVCGCSDPAWPARLLTRACMVSEHLRDQIHSLYEPLLPQLAKSGKSAMDDSKCKHLVVFLEIGYNTRNYRYSLRSSAFARGTQSSASSGVACCPRNILNWAACSGAVAQIVELQLQKADGLPL